MVTAPWWVADLFLEECLWAADYYSSFSLGLDMESKDGGTTKKDRINCFTDHLPSGKSEWEKEGITNGGDQGIFLFNDRHLHPVVDLGTTSWIPASERVCGRVLGMDGSIAVLSQRVGTYLFVSPGSLV